MWTTCSDRLEKLIAKKRAIKNAAMQQLLTGKTRLQGFRGAWDTRRLGDTFTFLPTANNPRGDLRRHGQVGYIHYGDVHAQARPVLNCSNYDLPRTDKNRVGKATPLEDGDLVVADASEDLLGVGKSVEVEGLAGQNVVAGLHTILCRGNPECWAKGFKAYIQFIPAFRLALTRMATGISVYAISKRHLTEISLPLASTSRARVDSVGPLGHGHRNRGPGTPMGEDPRHQARHDAATPHRPNSACQATVGYGRNFFGRADRVVDRGAQAVAGQLAGPDAFTAQARPPREASGHGR